MEQAAKAERKEAERKARLETGMKSIGEIFHGKEKTAPQKAQLKGIAAMQPGEPSEGYYDYLNNDLAKAGASKDMLGDSGWSYRKLSPAGGYAIYDPTGGMRGLGGQWADATAGLEGAEYMKEKGTGEFENDPFAPIKDKYKTNLTELHGRNLNTTYNKALDEALFATARAGQRGSTTARDVMTEIGGRRFDPQTDGTFKAVDYGQYGEAKNKITSDIDKSLGDLTTQIQSAEDSAENQLYMTEDPEKAANAAHQLAANIPAVPQYNTLGDMFKPLVIGATGFYSGYQGQNALNNAGFPQSRSPLGSGASTISKS
jgi:hypothetical protein